MSSPKGRLSIGNGKKRTSATNPNSRATSPTSQEAFGMASSPNKWKVLASKINTNMNIVKEMNREDNLAQEKDIEIERLRTTAAALNSQVNLTDDMKQKNEYLSKEVVIL